jgi:hypothetical protein
MIIGKFRLKISSNKFDKRYKLNFTIDSDVYKKLQELNTHWEMTNKYSVEDCIRMTHKNVFDIKKKTKVWKWI